MSDQKKRYSGKPMSEEELKDWQKAFSDIEESIDALYKSEKKAYNGSKEKSHAQKFKSK